MSERRDNADTWRPEGASWATVDFCDGNKFSSSSWWRESGWIVRKGNGFVLYVAGKHGERNGSRVFPLSGRRAEVMIEESEEHFVVEED